MAASEQLPGQGELSPLPGESYAATRARELIKAADKHPTSSEAMAAWIGSARAVLEFLLDELGKSDPAGVLREFEALVAGWRGYAAANPCDDVWKSESGYNAGLLVCAEQAAELIERVRADV